MDMEKPSTNAERGAAVDEAVVLEMRAIVRRAGEPWQPGDSVKAALRRAARKLGLSYRRTKTFWYGEPCSVRAVEADRLRAVDLALLREQRNRLEADLNLTEARLNAREGGNAMASKAHGMAIFVDRAEGIERGGVARKARLSGEPHR